MTTLAEIQQHVGVPADGKWGPVTANAIGRALGIESGLVPSSRCADLIKSFESCRLDAYMPTPNDVPTIGWGSTKGVRMGDRWTQAEADAAFARELDEFADGVLDALGGAVTTQGQFDAMVSLAYNIGLGAFGKSTLLKLHKAGDYAGAADQFGKWVKQAGVTLRGLVRRREAEARLYRGVS